MSKNIKGEIPSLRADNAKVTTINDSNKKPVPEPTDHKDTWRPKGLGYDLCCLPRGH